MNHIVICLAWCGLQVLLIAGAAFGLSLLASRRSAIAGAVVGWFGMLMVLMVSWLAFVPLPRIYSYAINDRQAASSPVLDAAARHELQAPQESSAAEGSEPRPAFALPQLHDIVASLRRSETAALQHERAAQWIVAVVGLGALLSMLQVVIGVAAVASLRRRSRLLSDPGLTDVVAGLAGGMKLPRSPLVGETNDLASAAVVGWWQPTVLLPAGWRDWSAAELHAVLAHELAHIARRDFAWRLLAALTVALHWCQPLVYLLRRQLVLAQELAADELAAAAVGGKREYLRALTQFALRQDSQRTNGPAAALLPVFSGFLVRRIAMLRAKDGSTRPTSRSLMQGCAIGLIAGVALVSTALRSVAQPPEVESDGSVRVARSTDSKPKPTANATAEQAVGANLFQRPAFDFANMALNKRGGILVQLGEIFQQPRFAGLAAKQDLVLAETWKATFPDSEPPRFSLADIEYIAADFFLMARYLDMPKEDNTQNQIMFGALGGVIRWQRPVDDVFQSLQQIPGVTLKHYSDLPYVTLLIPAMGPVETCICRLDERTFLWAGGEEVLHKRLDRFAAASEMPAWYSAWKQVDGGLLTVVAAESEYESSPQTELPEEVQFTKDLFAQVRSIAAGADWSGTDGQEVAVKLQLQFASQAETDRWKVEIQQMIDRGVQEIRDGLKKENADEKAIPIAQALLSILQQGRIDTHEIESGWQIDVQFRGPIAMEAVLNPSRFVTA